MSELIYRRWRRPGRCLALGVSVVCLWASPLAQAQALHEIVTGSVGEFASDIFECGRQLKERKECGLSYRYYCVDAPDEVNSPSMPASGFPQYRPKKQLYLADPLHTGNFPAASMLGPGHAWNLLWDGVRDADSPGHIGYYAAVSQIVERGELGNPMSTTCLPVIGQYACFGMKDETNVNVVRNSPLGDIPPLGGLAPIPVPILLRNGTDTITFVWEQAASQGSRDGAPLPIQGYRLFAYPNPVDAPTEAQLRDAAVAVSDVIPVATTRFELERSHAALADAVTLSAAIRMVYAGGLESLYFSANGQTTGLAFPDTAATKEMDDAATGTGGVGRAIDIEDLFLEIRQKKTAEGADQALLVVTVDLVGEPSGRLVEGTGVRVHIDFNDEGLGEAFTEPGKADTQDITMEATLKKTGDAVRADFSGLPGIAADSSIDTKRGRVTFAVPLDRVIGVASNAQLRAADAGGGQRRILVWAESSRGEDVDRVPNTNDGKPPSVSGEVVKFTF